MFDLIATVLASFYSVVNSYGLAIVLLTLAVMAVTSPLTYKGTKSMIQLQRLQPQLKAIQTKYRDDREKMNQELLAFYKQHNVNPVGGCLPMLIQIPVFLVLYRVVNGLTARFTDVGLQGGTTAMNSVTGVFTRPSEELAARADHFNPAYISHDSALFKDLSNATEMSSWGIDLSESASKALSQSFGHAIPYLVLIAIVLVTGVFQQRQIQGRQAKHGTSSPINSQQQMIMKIMPFFLPVFSFGVPSALVVYFIVSNLWRIGQQAVITRTLYSGAPAPALPIEVDEVESPKPAGKTAAKAGAKSDRAVQATDTTKDTTPARSPMGRNRRAAEDGGRAPRPRPKPKPKPNPDRTPSGSGRVTPPGTSARKKKRT